MYNAKVEFSLTSKAEMILNKSQADNSGREGPSLRAISELEEDKSIGFTNNHSSRHCKIPSILSNISRRNPSMDSWFVDLPDVINKEDGGDVAVHPEEFQMINGYRTSEKRPNNLDDLLLKNQPFVGPTGDYLRSTPRHKIFDMNSPKREEFNTLCNKGGSSGKKISEKVNLLKIEPHLPPTNEEI